MMNPECEVILMRQFDDDCKNAEHLPNDVQMHLSRCATCQQEWLAARQFDQQVTSELKQTPSNQLYRRSYNAVVASSTEQKSSDIKWSKILLALGSGITGAASVHVLAGFHSIHWISVSVFLFIASAVYVAGMLRDLNDEMSV